MSKLTLLIISVSFLFVTLLPFACARSYYSTTEGNSMVNEKVSSQLLAQVNLRNAQIAAPTPDRLTMMKELGMNVDNLKIQRIFIHLTRELTPSQIEEIKAMGITLYPDSWIPPVGSFPTGYLIADLPIDKLAELTRINYVVRLETAEQLLQPQNGFQPQ